MRFRPLLALMLAFCLTFTTLPSSASAALKGREQGNARFGNVVNTGQADACTVLPAGSSGSINADGQFKSLCLQPTEVSVKLPGNKRNKSDFAIAKIISPRFNTSLDEVYGDLSGGKFTEKGGIDFSLITVLAPNGEEFPFAFSVCVFLFRFCVRNEINRNTCVKVCLQAQTNCMLRLRLLLFQLPPPS